MRQRKLLHKPSSYEISRRAFTIIKSFLKGKFLVVVVSSQWSEAHQINDRVTQGYLIDHTVFLPCINNLPKNIRWSLVNIYADDTTYFKRTPKDLHDQNESANLSSDLTQLAQLGKDWLVKRLDSNNAKGPNKIPVIVPQNISLELCPVLAKLFNRCLEERCFLCLWKVSNECSVFKKVRVSAYACRNIGSLTTLVSSLNSSNLEGCWTPQLDNHHSWAITNMNFVLLDPQDQRGTRQ